MAREPKKSAETSATAAPVKKEPPAKKPVAPKAAKPASATAEKKPAAPKKPASAEKAAAKPRAPKGSKATVTPEARYRMIQDAAYFIAEKHGFTGDNHGFWLQAEQEIDAKLG